jgi:hypothetical protein
MPDHEEYALSKIDSVVKAANGLTGRPPPTSAEPRTGDDTESEQDSPIGRPAFREWAADGVDGMTRSIP